MRVSFALVATALLFSGASAAQTGRVVVTSRLILPEGGAGELSGGQHETLLGLEALRMRIAGAEVLVRQTADDPSTERVFRVTPSTSDVRLLGGLDSAGIIEVVSLDDVPFGFLSGIRLLEADNCGSAACTAITLSGAQHAVDVPSGALRVAVDDIRAAELGPDTVVGVELQLEPFAPGNHLHRSRARFWITPSIPARAVDVDLDGDGHLQPRDCDDHNPAVFPGAFELCNEIDDDCDALVDEGVTERFFADADGDGSGDEQSFVDACSLPAGHVYFADDCNDGDAAVHPGAPEVCDDGIDQDCDAFGDDLSCDDVDGDGDGFTPSYGDCNDADPAVRPLAPEVCNGVDDDCDGGIDDGVAARFYRDADGDGAGSDEDVAEACAAPLGYVARGGDCDDLDPATGPFAPELCESGADEDCDGIDPACDELDGDGDGHVGALDCDDTDARVHPGAFEACENGLDEDCSGFDEPCPAPDPSVEMTPPDPTVPAQVLDVVAELLYGPAATQEGVAAGAIVPADAAVVRGRVTDFRGVPLGGVTVRVAGRDEFGTTRTGENGLFHLVVNGGAPLFLEYSRVDLLPVTRRIEPPCFDYIVVADVAMRRPGTSTTMIDTGGAAPPQLALGEVVVDQDGERRTTLWFAPETSALVDGAPAEALAVNASEYSAGPLGHLAVPGDLPPNVGYLYGLELSGFHEGARAGEVTFDRPVSVYVDDFIGLPVGTPLPVGKWDEEDLVWRPDGAGVVLRVLGALDGGAALVDADGDGEPDDEAALLALGLSLEERAEMGVLYPDGHVLWRFFVASFSSRVIGLPFVTPAEMSPPEMAPPTSRAGCDRVTESGHRACDLVLRTELDIDGSELELTYSSDRALREAAFQLDIPLLGESVPAGLLAVEAVVETQGREVSAAFDPEPGLGVVYTWNGENAFAQRVNGQQRHRVDVRYRWAGLYQLPSPGAVFGEYGAGVTLNVPTRARVTSVQAHYSTTRGIGAFDAAAFGLGGWSVDLEAVWNPAIGAVEGSHLPLEPAVDVVLTVAGTGVSGIAPDGTLADEAPLSSPQYIAIGPDRSLYVSERGTHSVRRIDSNGRIRTAAGNGTQGFAGDGGPATSAALDDPHDVVVAPDGTLFIADTGNHRVRMVRNATITTYAGNGEGDGAPEDGADALSSPLPSPHGLALGPDGSLYVTSVATHSVYRVGLDGAVRRLAGIGHPGPSGDGGLARMAHLSSPKDIAVGPDGSLYIADFGNSSVRIVTPDGRIDTFVRTEDFRYDGWEEFQDVELPRPAGVAVSPSGELLVLVSDESNDAIWRISSDRVATRVAGAPFGSTADGVTATEARLSRPRGLVFRPQGGFYFVDAGSHRVRLVVPDAPLPGDPAPTVFTRDGRRLDFAASGKLLAVTASPTRFIEYDANGWLTAIVEDGFPVLEVERDADGTPLSLVAETGQTTDLGLVAGLINQVVAASTTTSASYLKPDGLLTSWTVESTAPAVGFGTELPPPLIVVVDYDDGGLAEPAEILGFTVQPPVIAAGSTGSLAWSTRNVVTCRIDGPSEQLDSLPPEGTRQIRPAASGVYTLTCDGPGGPVVAWIDVVVNDEQPAQVISATNSTVTLSHDELLADGERYAEARVVLRDQANQPVPGYRVRLHVNRVPVDLIVIGSSPGVIVIEPPPTDESGTAVGYVASTSPGDFRVSARYQVGFPMGIEQGLAATPTIHFADTADAFDRSEISLVPFVTDAVVGVFAGRTAIDGPLAFPTDEDYARYASLEQDFAGSEVIAGVSVVAPDEGMIVSAPVVFFGDASAGALAGDRSVVIGATSSWSFELGTYFVPGGEAIVLGIAGGDEPGGQGFCGCGDAPGLECPGDGGGGVCPDPLRSDCDGVAAAFDASAFGCGKECLKPVQCTDGATTPGLPNSEKLAECNIGPADVPELCQHFAGDGCAGYCEDFDDRCFSLEYGGGFGEGFDEQDLKCDFAGARTDEDCYTDRVLALAQETAAAITRDWPHLLPTEKLLLCARRSTLQECQDAVVPISTFCDDDDSALCELLDVLDPGKNEIEQYCDELAPDLEQACIRCFAMTGGSCIPMGPDPRVVDGESPPPAPPEKPKAPTSERKNNGEGNDKEPDNGSTEEGKLPDEGGSGKPKTDPVAIGSGELVFSSTDVSFPSRGVPFAFERGYRSAGARSGALGPGWVHAFEDYLEPIGDRFNRKNAPRYCVDELPKLKCVVHYDGDGGQEMYVYDRETGVFSAGPGGFATLRFDGEYFRMRTTGGIERTYNVAGRLESVRDEMGFGLDVKWRVKEAHEIERDGNPFRYGVVDLFDSLIEQYGYSFDGMGQPLSTHPQGAFAGRNAMAHLELASVTDSFGRVFSFVHRTYPMTESDQALHPCARRVRSESEPPASDVRRRRLHSICLDGEPLVEYGYEWLEETRDAYLTRVTRRGVRNAGLVDTEPRATRYEYQHDILKAGGALHIDDSGRAETEWGQEIWELAQRLERDMNACYGRYQAIETSGLEKQPGCSGRGGTALEPVERVLVLDGVTVFGQIQRAIADNIVRVRAGPAPERGGRDRLPDVESFFDPDPRRPDFDRVVAQRFGAEESLSAQPPAVVRGDATLFTWQSNYAELRLRQIPSGAGEAPSSLVPSYSVALEGLRVIEIAELDTEIYLESPAMIENPLLHSDWHEAGVALPDQVLAAIPFVDSEPEEVPPATTCPFLDSLDELPTFAIQDPAGRRADEDLTSMPAVEPTVARTRESCAAISGRQARDAFKNENVQYCGDEPGLPRCEDVPNGKLRRRALEWDLARVCRWVNVERRDGALEYYGLNFYGQTLVEAVPAAGADPLGAALRDLLITTRRFNADGLLIEERRQVTSPDDERGGRTLIEYHGQDDSAVSVLFRPLEKRITEVAATAPHLDAVDSPARTWEIRYEPVFQQWKAIRRPDLTLVERYFDYEQMDAGWRRASELRDRMRSAGFSFVTTTELDDRQSGERLRFLDQDLDGDGQRLGERSAGAVVVVERGREGNEAWEGTGVALGGRNYGGRELRADVGVRYERDSNGRVMRVTKAREALDPALDFEPVEIEYYGDVASSEAGSFSPLLAHLPYGPVARVRTLRTDGAEAASDVDEVAFTYDALGGVRRTVRNGDVETEIVTLRDSLGSVVEEDRSDQSIASYRYDERGDLIESHVEDVSGEMSPPRKEVLARTRSGVLLGSCVPIESFSSCDGFLAFAASVSPALRSGAATAVLEDASYSITVFDDDDRPSVTVDAAGGRTDYSWNAAGLLARQVILGEPSSVLRYGYDELGRVLEVETRDAETGEVASVERSAYDGYHRVAATQRYASLAGTFHALIGRDDGMVTESSDDLNHGTVTESRYDLNDRLTETFTIGDDGTGARRVLMQRKLERNEAGSVRFEHALAVRALPPSPLSYSPASFATTETRYDAALRPIHLTRTGIEEATTLEHDGFGLGRIATPNVARDIVYDPAARTVTEHVVSLPDGDGATATSATYVRELDGLYRTVKRARFDVDEDTQAKTDIVYDGHSQVVSVMDESMRSIENDFDHAGRLVARREIGRDDTVLRTRRYRHDALGRLVLDEGEEGQATRYRYDAAGRLRARIAGERFPEANRITTELSWDAAGRNIGKTKSLAGGGTRSVVYSFDENEAAPSSVLIEGEVAQSFVRDGLMRVVAATDVNLVQSIDDPGLLAGPRTAVDVGFSYDTLGRLTSEGAAIGGAALALATTTFPADFRGALGAITPGGEQLSYSYSEKGNLASLRRGGASGRHVAIDFSWEGGLWVTAALFGDGTSYVQEKRRSGFGGVEGSALYSGASVVRDQDVLYGPENRVVAERRRGPLSGVTAKAYGYDGLGRLRVHTYAADDVPSLEAFKAARTSAFADEDVGLALVPGETRAEARFSLTDNLESIGADEDGRSYDAAFQTDFAGAPPKTVNGAAIERDDEHRIRDDGRLEYVYDALDRLVLVLSHEGEELRLAYDALGRRRVENGRVLCYQGANVVEELDASTFDVVRTVTHGPGIDVPLLASDGGTDMSSDSTYVIGTDVRGDAVVALRASDGSLVEEAVLEPWGERKLFLPDGSMCVDGVEDGGRSLPLSGCAASSTVLARFGIGGARQHERTKLVDLRGRVYATHLKAFLTRDPLGNVDADGAHVYAIGDPVNWRDPWGLAATQNERSVAAHSEPESGVAVIMGESGSGPGETTYLGGLNGTKAPSRITSDGFPGVQQRKAESGGGYSGSSGSGSTSGYGGSSSSGDGSVEVARRRTNQRGYPGGLRNQAEVQRHRQLRDNIKMLEAWINRYRDPKDPYQYKPPPRIHSPGTSPLTEADLRELLRVLNEHMERGPDPNSPMAQVPPTSPEPTPTGAPAFPGWDPTVAPEGYVWRGKPGSSPGSPQGNYFNPRTGESLRPDLNHPPPIESHWDYRDPNGGWWRIFPNGRAEPK